jgi:predicted glycogen debranching enzyme
MLLVNGLDAYVSTIDGDYAISAQAYQPGTIHPEGYTRIAGFVPDPWPTWQYRLEDGTLIEHELFMVHGTPLIALCWRLKEPREGVSLVVRPLISGRDYHGVHIQNPVFNFGVERSVNKVVWRPYEGVPAVIAFSNGEYQHEPEWYNNYFYALERERGLEDTEDLAAPGIFRFNLSAQEGVLLLCAEGHDYAVASNGDSPHAIFANLRQAELERRARFATPLHRSADQYLVERCEGRTVIAGYPWFNDWGRDTFIAMRGLCLATGQLEQARAILLVWSGLICDGMLPNCFPDYGTEPNYGSVDAALWFVVAVHEYLTAAALPADDPDAQTLRQACLDIVRGYRRGVHHNIRMDDDGLLMAGEAGLQLTWMDAKVDDWVVTPRRGKPVEVQALWINALELAGAWAPEFLTDAARAREAFAAKFWNPATNCLFDVVDVDGEVGAVDPAIRPNQVFAVGGLPRALLSGDRALRVLATVQRELLTPYGLRTLAPGDPAYQPQYLGGIRQRDGAYHQGTVWPWLLGPFVEAWLNVHGHTPETRATARKQFLEPLIAKLHSASVGHLPEIADAEAPHAARGCPFQAWSMGELLRMKLLLLRTDA